MLDLTKDHSGGRDQPHNCLTLAFRQRYYTEPTPIVPLVPAPEEHTSKAQNFLEYIGRNNVNGFEIRGKKLSHPQREALASAYRASWPIRVIGAIREDIELVAQTWGYRILPDSKLFFQRPNKAFNQHRQMVCTAAKVSDPDLLELWVVVFPSSQYVDQVSELFQAIINDFNRNKLATSTTAVTTWHFRHLEKALVRWSAFDDNIRHYVQPGDVVAIGNLESFIPGLKDFGFQETRGWRNFGLQAMFGVKTFVHRGSRSRIVLVGFSESFWGDASARYVSEIIEAGANHILYGSKAASLLGLKTVHNMLAPTVFSNIEMTDRNEPDIVHIGTHHSDLYSILEQFGIDRGQIAITVPTVIGESNEQREIYENTGPGCLDCENGHIARVVSRHNAELTRMGASPENLVQFIPVHFITDYIYKVEEAYDSETFSLGSDPATIASQKNERFRTIGKFFATYALMHGVKEHFSLPSQSLPRSRASAPAEDLAEKVRPFVDAGLGSDAIATLLSLHSKSALPTNALMAVAMMTQKCGFVDLFDSVMDALSERGEAGLLSPTDIFHRQVLHLKVMSQVADYCGVIDFGERIRSESNPLMIDTVHQFGAVQRRLAVAYAAAGNQDRSTKMLAEARAEVPKHRADHYRETNSVFEHIAHLHLYSGEGVQSLRDISQKLSEIRRNYLSQAYSDPNWWQLNLEKCAIAALFLEASYFLDTGDANDRESGMKRLYAAHLLNGRMGGNPRSETYGEIVAAIKNPEIRTIVTMAMRRDGDGPSPFQDFLRARYPSVMIMAKEALELLRSGPLEREDALLNLIEARTK